MFHVEELRGECLVTNLLFLLYSFYVPLYYIYEKYF